MCVKGPLQAQSTSSPPVEAPGLFCGEGERLIAKKKNKKKKKVKGAKSQMIEVSSTSAKELELLKSEHASLVCKYESLAKQYDYAIKSFSCVATVDRAIDMLEAKLGKITSKT